MLYMLFLLNNVQDCNGKRNKKKKNLHAGESVILDFSIENSNFFFLFDRRDVDSLSFT